MPCCCLLLIPAVCACCLVPCRAVLCCAARGQVPKGVSLDQIRGIFSPYGEIADLNVMPPKKDGAMGEGQGRGCSSWAAAAAWCDLCNSRQECLATVDPTAIMC